MTQTKNILLISTCFHKLHELEFVNPIEKIVSNMINKNKYQNIIDYSTEHINSELLLNENFIKKFSHIIICGTALKDFQYLNSNYLEILNTCKNYSINVLGICAGAQLICKFFNFKLIENMKNGIIEVESVRNKIKIQESNFNVNEFTNSQNIYKKVYALHTYTIKQDKINPENKDLETLMIEKGNNFIQFAKIKNFNFVFFHPEIKNKEIIEEFILKEK